jgi:hypothetical protein
VGKRVVIGLAVVLLAAAAFGAGWAARGPGQPTVEQPGEAVRAARWQPGKEDEAEFWKYPKADSAGSAQGGPQHIAAFTTPDDLATVAAWYGERLGDRIPLGDPGAIGSGGGPDVFAAACDDSFRPGAGARPARPVRVGFGARSSPASAVAVAISRAEGEDRTHILVSFSKR